MLELKPTVSYEDFAKLDIRVATIKEVVFVEESSKLIKLTLDLGEETRTVFAGIKNFYQPEELEGMQIVFLANLEPKKMPGGESQGMLLAAEGDTGGPILLVPNEPAQNGAAVL